MNQLRKRSEFRISQEKAYEIGFKKRKYGLFLGMGIGKTVVSLTIAKDFLEEFFVCRVLIIAPLRVVNNVWKQEAKQWDHLQDLRISICTGNEEERLKNVNSKADIYVINRENVEWLITNCEWKWDMVILDESSSFKNHASKRFKALKKVTKYIKSIFLLSGTPKPNSEMDLWSQIYLLDNGERLGRTITQFRKRFFIQNYMGYGYDLKPGAAEEIRELIKDICMSMSTEDYIDLPPVIFSNIYVDLPKKALKQYQEIEKNFLLQLENEVNIEAPSVAASMNKLLQICNGAIYDNDNNIHEIHDEKIYALKDIIEDNPNENFLVAYNFRSDLERIKKAFPEARVLSSDPKDVEDWNNGKIKILLTHPASAGHGLNLQFGGNIVIWFGLNWSLELYEQFNKRLDRPGQKNIVRIFHIIARNCIDEKTLESLGQKATSQKQLMNFLKFEIQKYYTKSISPPSEIG